MGFKLGLFGLIFVAFCFSFSYQNDETLVPVLIWSHKNPDNLVNSHNSLHNYNTNDFTSYLIKLINNKKQENNKLKTLLLCFIEPLLSVEDFTSNVYPNIKNNILPKSKFIDYIPSVDNSFVAIKNLEHLGDFIVSEVYEQDIDINNINVKDNVDVLIIKLNENDLQESKNQKHDDFIKNIYNQILEQRKNVIGLLTGELSLFTISSLIRSRRSIDGSNETSTASTSEFSKDILTKNVFASSGKYGISMIHSYKSPILNLNGNQYILTKDSKTDVKLDDRTDFQRFLITFFPQDGSKINLKFRFDKEQHNKWSLKTVEVESPKQNVEAVTLTASSVISSNMGHSFLTNKPVEFKSADGKITLSFENGLQVQPWISESLNEKFGPANDDIQYFTPGIWMGIMVMSILALVFTLGITMILDIRSMDRFDDAKGKTININVTD